MKSLFYKKLLVLLQLAVAMLAVSCTYDDLDPKEDPENPEEAKGYYLSLKVNLASLTRDGSANFEQYEDYINPNSLQLLFFYGNQEDSEYNRLFKIFNFQEFSFVPAESTGSNMARQWYIRIPIREEDGEDFADKLRKQPFKIAVLANWPEIPAETALMEEIRDGDGTITRRGDHINKLHHLATSDTYYNEKKPEYGETYGYLYKNNYGGKYLGLNKGWIKDDYNEASAAADYIRNQYGPADAANGLADKHGDLWLIWNFKGAYTGSKDDYSGNIFAERWAKKNSDDLGKWLKASSEKIPLKDIEELKDNMGNPKDAGNFRFVSGGSYYDEDLGGIRLKERKLNSDNSLVSENIIKFNVPNSGHTSITWGSTDNNEAKIRIERRNHDTDSGSKDTDNSKEITVEDITKEAKTTTNTYDITGDSEIIYVYALTDNVIIYSIEHIGDDYLYNIGRHGVELDPEEYTIPMYGVQTFAAIGESNWAKGTAFDVSDFNRLGTGEYTPKTVHLLRSVAKVVLEIPKTYKSHHVYLRSMNRTSRCEPMDVSTPTDEIWKDHVESTTDDHSHECEWFQLIGHEPFYKKYTPSSTQPNPTTQLTNYQKKLAWYYGSWADKNGEIGGITVPRDNTNYPHILNPMINRSDFTEFIEGGSDSYYNRYVLYVPEKFVDDPGNIGSGNNMETTTPKVCHVEFRIAGDPVSNIDDNNCYRIYFTEGGYQTVPDETPPFDGRKLHSNKDHTWENCYEKNEDNLKKHWPIMRNHVYKFTVIDNDNRVVITKLEVLPWLMVEINNNYQW